MLLFLRILAAFRDYIGEIGGAGTPFSPQKQEYSSQNGEKDPKKQASSCPISQRCVKSGIYNPRAGISLPERESHYPTGL